MFPLLVAVVFGVIDGGRLIASRVMLTYAVSHGARVAALGSTTTQTAGRRRHPGRGAADRRRDHDHPGGVHHGAAAATARAPAWRSKVAGNRVSVTATYTYAPAFFTSFARTLTQTSWVVVE